MRRVFLLQKLMRFAALLAQRRTLLLGYTESFAETLDLGEGD